MIKKYIDIAIFIDTHLDIALARRILRDMETSTGDEIRNDLNAYLKYARIAYLQMLKDILPSSDYVIDGSLEVDKIVDELVKFINDIH
jgi:uridine kinase